MFFAGIVVPDGLKLWGGPASMHNQRGLIDSLNSTQDQGVSNQLLIGLKDVPLVAADVQGVSFLPFDRDGLCKTLMSGLAVGDDKVTQRQELAQGANVITGQILDRGVGRWCSFLRSRRA